MDENAKQAQLYELTIFSKHEDGEVTVIFHNLEKLYEHSKIYILQDYEVSVKKSVN